MKVSERPKLSGTSKRVADWRLGYRGSMSSDWKRRDCLSPCSASGESWGRRKTGQNLRVAKFHRAAVLKLVEPSLCNETLLLKDYKEGLPT
jgi:hypothetical protein